MPDGPVLVTGATGFVGSHLVDRLLDAGIPVRVTVRATSNLRWIEGKPVERVEADLRDPDQLRGAVAGTRAVLHFGGRTRGRTRQEFFEDNAGGTARLAAAFAAGAPADGTGLFLYCSSLSAGGPAPEDTDRPFPHVREEDPPRPVSPYGESKLEGERGLGPLEGRARIVILRPPAVYGSRDESILRFFRMVERGWLLLPRPREARFSVIHVSDLVEATILALDDTRAEGVYYLSDGEVHSWQDVGRVTAELLGIRPRTVRVPAAATVLAAVLGEIGARFSGKAPLLGFSKLRELRQKYWVCLPEKATRDFAFHPRTEISRGLEETILWYRRHGWLRGAR